MEHNVLAAFFGLLSSLSIAWGTVVRHRAGANVTVGRERSSGAAARAVIGRGTWWGGLGLAVLGYGLQIVALGFGTLLIVQPMLVLSLVFTLPLASLAEGRHIKKEETAWALMLSAAVAALVVVGRPNAGMTHPPLHRWIPAMAVGVFTLFILDRIAHQQKKRHKATLLGVITGGIYGYVALLSKAVTDIFIHDGVVDLLLSWELWALCAGAIFGTIVQQSAFHAGELKHSLPAMTIVEPIVAFTLGYLVLGEHFAVAGSGWIAIGIAMVAMVVSAVALSQRGIG